jgi:hypothetical protein
MKKTIFIPCFMLLATVLISSCKKASNTDNGISDPACSGCERTTATAEFDSSGQGVYKGVTLSGTGIGHFRVYLKSGGTESFIKLHFVRETYPEFNDTLRYSGILQVPANTTIYPQFLGSASRTQLRIQDNGQSADCGDYVLSGSIGTGPYPQSSMFKEYSNAQVKVFEGTMTGVGSPSPNGKVGFVVRGNQIIGVITSSTNAIREHFYNGTLNANNQFSFSFTGNNSVYSGQLTSPTTISGSFTVQGSPAGTFVASRTL